jgi:hypothetical protein
MLVKHRSKGRTNPAGPGLDGEVDVLLAVAVLDRLEEPHVLSRLQLPAAWPNNGQILVKQWSKNN